MNEDPIVTQSFLRRALLGNAFFSAISAVVVIVADQPITRLLGIPAGNSLIPLAIGLIFYSLMLVLNARSARIKIVGAWAAICMDALWVAGSAALLLIIPFTVAARWTIFLVSEIVLLFAVLQWLGIRRIRKAERYG